MGRRVRASEMGIEMGIEIGSMEPGRLNDITDFEGVGVARAGRERPARASLGTGRKIIRAEPPPP